jgi:hypothetical protein
VAVVAGEEAGVGVTSRSPRYDVTVAVGTPPTPEQVMVNRYVMVGFAPSAGLVKKTQANRKRDAWLG